MGDCSSRPGAELRVEHEFLEMSKHDDRFYRSPDLSFASDVNHIEEIRLQDELEQAQELQKRLQSYRQWIDEYLLFLSKRLADQSWVSVKRLLVEVQKGRDLHYPHTCLNDASLYVAIRLEPGMPAGKAIHTTESRNDIPKWGRCFELKMSKDYNQLVLTVKVHRKRLSEVDFGTVSVKLKTLTSQKMVHDWFPVVTTFTDNEKPTLMLRLQYITDERALIEDCRAAFIEAKSEAELMRSKLQALIQRAMDRIMPEGRG